jgi:phosphoglycolate phosphatase-like HAD superfamily hydrolase
VSHREDLGQLTSRPELAMDEIVTRWDLDKTYLRSRFDTLRELMNAAIERPEQKRAVPGAAAVLRELSGRGARICILSGSPRQMRKTLSAKLALDGVRYDELTLKPNLSNLARLRFRALRDQLGYKLPELLAARARDTSAYGERRPREFLVGDDSESDAFVYSLYADVCAGTVGAEELERVLEVGETYREAVHRCRQALPQIARVQIVDRILIHLDGQTPPSRFREYGSRLVPFYNYFQAACVLLERRVLSPEAVLRIAAEFIELHGFSPDSIARSYLDLLRRGHAAATAPAMLEAALTKFDASRLPMSDLSRAVTLLGNDAPRQSSELEERVPRLDYGKLAERYRGGRNRRRPGMSFG